MIIKGSRYSAQQVVSVVDANGDSHLTLFSGRPNIPFRFTYYQVKDGDRMDTIAYRFLNDSSKWWQIADANPEVFYPDSLQSGSIIRIPSN